MLTYLTAAADGYTALATGFNTAFPQTPDAVVAVSTPEEVVEAIAYARDLGLPVRVIATGHGTHGPVDHGLLINVAGLSSVVVDPVARTATIGGGTRWAQVVAAAAEHGLAPITGSSTNVGVVGFITGGGLGPLARSHGFASDWVRGFTLATAAGEVLTVTADENADLFWALRGGKDGFGVVIDVTIELVPLDSLYAGALIFAEEHIEQVLRGWAAWTLDARADVTTSVVVIGFPPFEQVPEPFRGRRLLMLRFAYPGDIATGEQLAAPLRALAPIYIDGLRPLPIADVALIHNDPSDPGPGWGLGGMLTSVQGGLVDTVLSFVGPGSSSPFLALELRHVGAQTRVDVPEGSAVGGRNSDYTFHIIGAPDPSLFESVLPGAGAGFTAAVAEWLSPETTVNFANVHTIDRAWPAETRARLDSIRAAVDPTGMFPFDA
ncbi:FAD-binding oxidoreductase [Salinibacterium soli]|uniref:FAD-binding oxidoreductase n=1 Tax=Antiquaquibacter soli TaxID=3064523 RepID=A0ABT9BLF9_9MICO|nr:FAD-binding oxidoreductase [Protaetiibacter sp. WY-16]MDO7880601.1 FAD-binding oxidoreductase [Protaetiibacter sp. WY-16]